MKKRITLFVMSSLFFTAGCTTDTTTSTTDSIATEARQDPAADLIRADDRVYRLDGKDATIKKENVISFSAVTKQVTAKQPLTDQSVTDWQSGTKLSGVKTRPVCCMFSKERPLTGIRPFRKADGCEILLYSRRPSH